jgi:cytidyltransferase-like protein
MSIVNSFGLISRESNIMKVLGIVVEYNPFHNGHLYHIERSKKICDADFTICVMSSNFIQRGEPSLVNKWARTRMALVSGVDLVIELPVIYSMSSAEYFAYGAVKLLDSLGIVDCLCFGSESGEIDILSQAANILVSEPHDFKKLLKSYLKKGMSFPSSREAALKDYIGKGSDLCSESVNTLESPNNILGIEYLKALKRLNSRIEPATISRFISSYNNGYLTGKISSATSIRKHLSGYQTEGISADASLALPSTSIEILIKEFKEGRGPISVYSFENIILSLIRRMSAEQIKLTPYVSEGLENRIKTAADNSGTFDELLSEICTKRYPKTRIQRILFNLLIGISKEDFDLFNKSIGPQYIRILGFNTKGRQLLQRLGKLATLPIITKTADYKNSCNPLLKRMLQIEARATDLYVLSYSEPKYRKSGQDFTQNIVIIP